MRAFQALSDQLHILLRRLDPDLGLFLERVQDIDHPCKTHGIDSAEGVTTMVLDNLMNAGALALPGFGMRMLSWCVVECIAIFICA